MITNHDEEIISEIADFNTLTLVTAALQIVIQNGHLCHIIRPAINRYSTVLLT